MKITKQQLKRIIKEELADSAGPTPDLHADVASLTEQVAALQAEMEEIRRIVHFMKRSQNRPERKNYFGP